MPRARRPWFRFYVEAMGDRKLRRLPVKHRWLWVVVLAAARQSHEPGWLYVSESEPFTADDLADFGAIPLRDVKVGMVALMTAGMVASEGGVWFVPRWCERQFESDDVTSRTRSHRGLDDDGNNVGTFQPRSEERSGNGVRNTPIDRGQNTDTETPPASASPSEDRADVAALCRLLADLVEANGCKRPPVTARWQTEARLLLDRDRRPPDEVERVMRWALTDPFWKSNIMSMVKFRAKYDQLKLRMANGNGHQSVAEKNAAVLAEFKQRKAALG